MPFRTLHLTNAYHATSGGIRTFYGALMEAANRMRRKIRFVVPAEQDRVEDAGPFVRTYHVRAPVAPAFDSRYRTLYPHRFLLPQSRVAEILRAERPDVVEIADKFSLHYLGAALYAGLLGGVGRPVVVGTTHERLDDTIRAWVGDTPLHRSLTRWYASHIYFSSFDHHVAVSPYTAEELYAAQPRKPRRRAPGITTLSMGVATERFAAARRSMEVRQEFRQQFGWAPRDRFALYAGRLSPEKNLSLLRELLESDCPDALRLLLIGSGPEHASWTELASRDRRVAVLPHSTDPEWMARVMASMDVFVHPNPREPFGIAPLEAMASGTPVVVPRAGGVLSYANDGNAWLAEPTAPAFRQAIEAALEGDPARIDAARATAEQLAWPKVTARHFKLYDRLAAEARQRESEPRVA